MTEALDCTFMKSFLSSLSINIMQQKDSLTAMDAACGDGDFGVGMFIGFDNVRRTVEGVANNDIGALLAAAGHAILSSVGGASGPLLGTFFIEAGKAAKGKSSIDVDDIASMFEMSLEKTRLRGGARVGDKTLVDALEPAVKSLREAANEKVSVSRALEMAAEAAKRGCESTKSLVAKYGKAKYLGEQTLGHEDPGAQVIEMIFENLLSAWKSSNPFS